MKTNNTKPMVNLKNAKKFLSLVATRGHFALGSYFQNENKVQTRTCSFTADWGKEASLMAGLSKTLDKFGNQLDETLIALPNDSAIRVYELMKLVQSETSLKSVISKATKSWFDEPRKLAVEKLANSIHNLMKSDIRVGFIRYEELKGFRLSGNLDALGEKVTLEKGVGEGVTCSAKVTGTYHVLKEVYQDNNGKEHEVFLAERKDSPYQRDILDKLREKAYSKLPQRVAIEDMEEEEGSL